MLGAFVLSMPHRPDVESLADYYEKAQMTSLTKWFCRRSGKSKFTPKDISRMKATAARKAAAQQAEDDAPRPAAQPQKPSKKESRKNAGIPDDVAELIAESVEDVCGEDGFAHMGKLSNLLMKKQPDFDPRNYGFSKLSKLVKALPRFEVDVRQGGQSNMKHFFVRDKERK